MGRGSVYRLKGREIDSQVEYNSRKEILIFTVNILQLYLYNII